MLRKAILIWVLGLVTIVPYGTYYLFMHATRDQYAMLITLVLFWPFGYWGVVGPVLGALKIRAVMRAIESAGSPEQLRQTLRSAQTREVAIDLIASENHIPRLLAARVFNLLVRRLAPAPGAADGQHGAGAGKEAGGRVPGPGET